MPDANLIHVPRDDFTKFDKRRANLLNGIANGLRAMFDWVIRVDADELICFDPARYSSLQDMFEQSGGPPALFALGLNLVEMPDDTDFDADMRVQRSSAAFSGHYSKAFATSGPADLLRHGVKVIEGELRKFPYTLPRGVFLVHLKYANLSANAANDIVRMQVATP